MQLFLEKKRHWEYFYSVIYELMYLSAIYDLYEIYDISISMYYSNQYIFSNAEIVIAKR